MQVGFQRSISFKPENNSSKIEEREEAERGFVVARGDSTEMLELVKHALNEVALLI